MTSGKRRFPASIELPGMVILGAVVVSTGCYTSHVRTPYAGVSEVQNRSIGTSPAFSYAEGQVPFTNHIEGTGATRLYEKRYLEIPSIGDNNQTDNLVTASYYRSTLPGSHPMVIVMPIWGTYTYPSRKMSKFIQRHADGRVHVLHVHGERYLVSWDELATVTDGEGFLEVFRQGIAHQRVTMIDTRRLVDWAEQRPEIDGGRVALIGFSYGAVVSGAILTQEPRFAAAALVMGGAEQHKVVAHCAGPRLTDVREQVARQFGWNADEFEALLEPIMRDVDAATYPGRFDPQKVLIVDARHDDCMPMASRESLWQTLGRPERITMAYDHRKSFYSMTPIGFYWLRYRIWEFLEPRLLDDSPLTE